MKWIEEGPDVETYKKCEEREGKTPTIEEIEGYKKTWQRDRLSWIKDSLPQEWKERYEALVDELGEPEHPDFASVTTTWVGPTSPKTPQELQAMSVSEIVDYLKRWEPPKDILERPTPEGLGRILAQVVSQDPARFAKEAESFKGLDPTYIRHLLSGFREARPQESFDWKPVLFLCQWVMEQPREIPDRREEPLDKDPHWGWARQEVARLLSAGFEEGSKEMPIDFKKLVWSILEPITDDPDPTPEEETKYGGTNMDLVTLSINTTRGEAMHTVIRYALWCKRHLKVESLEELPEVKKVLEKHLDPDVDPSFAIRSVYGQWFPSLVSIDKEWAKSHVGKIFPHDEPSQLFWEAAWGAYIVFCPLYFCPPYDEVFEVLYGEYEKAVEKMGKWSPKISHIADPDEKIAEHLMAFYLKGKINLTDRVLNSFWEKASDELRAHAMEFIGRSLPNIEEKEILKRSKLLWELRLKSAEESLQKNDYKKEIAAFGWWFISGRFENTWAFQQLLQAIKFSKRIEPTNLVVERLARLVTNYPKEAVRCFKELVDGEIEYWDVLGWHKEAEELLSIALESADIEAKELAEETIHKLGARDHLEFGKILKK
ncbi:MAG TPA: hypothetical protein ENG51_23350 [Deltaproteobacteria bacterium]|nr:hypothetical protein [Deltaproteobacteria bacterium]